MVAGDGDGESAARSVPASEPIAATSDGTSSLFELANAGDEGFSCC
jgi:hypothetical protein